MKEIVITFSTEKGEKALRQHCDELKNLKFKERMYFKAMGYKHIINVEPLSIQLQINNRHENNPNFIELVKDNIVQALKENGAILDEDYKLEVLA